ncbi:torsin-1A-interacting protein 2 isoform X2 [Parasteatoda tepidariorum]|nr:torsin-1A-interacting protein 2 isoform X2 [Parasteatoda tepidariorum]
MSGDEETGESGLQPVMIENSKISVEKFDPHLLKRRPIHEKENKQAKYKKQSSDQNEEKKAQISNTGSLVSPYSFLLCILILCVVVSVFYLYWVKTSYPIKDTQLDVQELISDLKSKFEGQPNITYKMIEAVVKRASKNPESPGIIVLIFSRKTKDITDKLANRLVQLVSDPHNFVLIDFRYFSTAEQLKRDIDDTIQGNLTQVQQVRAVLVRNLDQIPFEAAMIFHSLCDHENAPFKRVLYVMTASVEEETIPPESGQWDKLASKHLKAAWRDSGEDQVASLISRLTVNVAAVVSKE